MITISVIIIVLVVLVLLTGHPYKAIDKEKSDSYYYNVFKTEVRYVPMGNWFELGNRRMDSIDLKTVEVLGRKHIKDSAAVYFQDTRITDADADSFVVIDNMYAKDKNTVYYCSHSFQDVDINTIEFVKDEYIVLKDKNHSYSICSGNYDEYSNKNQVIPFLSEGHTFLSTNYSKDNEQVYYKRNTIAGADTKTFVLVYYGYAKDKNNVYYEGSILKGADSETFISLGNCGKDANKIYYYGKEVKGIDISSFAVIDKSVYTKDANGVYYDFRGVYDSAGLATHYVAIVIEGADPLTFEVAYDPSFKIDGKDKQRGYLRGRAVKQL